MKNIRNLSPETIELFEGEGYVNRELGMYELQRRLDAHGTHIMFSGSPDKLYIWDNVNKELLDDTTGWTLFDLLDFLNY